VITVIGVSLLPVAVRWAGGGVPGTSGFGAPANVGLTLLIILIIYRSYQDSSAGSRSWLAWSSAR
jgi:xanthine/uracil permease